MMQSCQQFSNLKLSLRILEAVRASISRFLYFVLDSAELKGAPLHNTRFTEDI
jgi:hypothetical protein